MSKGFHFLPLRVRAFLRHPRVRPYVITLFWSLTIFYFVFGALILFTRWYLLPQVDRFKDDIAGYLGRTTQSVVTIEAVKPSWDSFWPRLELTGVRFKKNDDRHENADVLNLNRLAASFYWRSFLGTPAFRRLVISEADLSLRLKENNTWDIAGFSFTPAADTGPSTSDDNPVIQWLLHQGELVVEKSRLRLIDLTYETPEEVLFTDVNAVFEKGLTDWKFGLQAVQASDTENPVDIRARFTTSLFSPTSDWRTWSGQLYAELSHFDFADLCDGTPLAKFLKKGRGHTRTWAEFSDGKVTSVTADVALNEAVLQFAENLKPLAVTNIRTRLTLENDDVLHLKAAGLSYRNAFHEAFGPVDITSDLVLTADKTDTESAAITVSALELEPLMQLLPHVPIPRPVADLIIRHRPRGHLAATTFSWLGSLNNPTDWKVTTDFDGLALDTGLSHRDQKQNPNAVGFGFSSLAGLATLTPEGGEVSLASPAARLTAQGVFAHPTLHADSLTGAVRWKNASTQPDGRTMPLTVTFDDVHVANADAEAVVSGTWRAVGPAGTADLKGRIIRAEARRVWRYMPEVVGHSVIRWLEAGLPRGTASDGVFEIRGDFTKFPWAKPEDNGRFFISTRVHDVTVDYVPSYRRRADKTFIPGEWPLLEKIEGQLTFEGAGMTVDADSAQTHGVAVTSARAVIPVLSTPEVTLTVDGKAQDQLGLMFDYVAASPVRGYVKGAFDGTTATGPGDLSLHLEIPLLHAWDTKVKGAVTLNDNDITMAHPVPPLTHAFGTVHFFERGAAGERITAKVWGRDVSADLSTDDNGTIAIALSGKASPDNIPYFADVAILKEALTHFKGETPFVGTVRIASGTGVSVNVQTYLEGVASDLPAPLAKKAGERWPSAFSLTPLKTSVGNGFDLTLSIDRTRFNTVLQLPEGRSRLLTRGSFAVGRRTGLPRSGLALEITGAELRADPWQPIIEKLIAAAAQSSEKDPSISGSRPPVLLERVTIDTQNFNVSQMDLGPLDVRAEMTSPEDWRIRISGDAADGTVNWNQNGQGSVRAAFTKLALPERSKSTLADAFEEPPKSLMPSLLARVDDFRLGKMHLGRINLSAVNRVDAEGRRWTIDSLTVENPGGTLTGAGECREKAGRFTTHVNAEVRTEDAGRLLSELGWPRALEDGRGTASAELTWDGTPWSPVIKTINGPVYLDLKKGSLRQVDTGVGGAVLTLFSMQSLVKRLQLDFSDLARDGFAFDSLFLDSTFKSGVLSTDNGRIIGPHASVLMTGSADFTTETLDSRVVVLPDINAGGASLAVAIVNPIVGISTFIAQMLMRDPLSKLFATEYVVKGPFSNPSFAKASDLKNNNTP